MGMQIVEMIFTLAILAIIFGSIFGFPVLKARMMQKGRDREGGDELRGEMTARLAELEERVKVLERIVTDERAELRRQFREL
jgi:Tfp pilus assembly protein FimT